MQYEGDVFRPPSEAYSLILQLTIGCAHNTCTFCTMYKDKRFRIRPIPEVLRELEDAAKHYPYRVERVFLADGDALIVKTEDLLTVIDTAYRLFPSCKRVSTYGTADDVLRKSTEELRLLRQHGLEMVYLGAESGSDEILSDIKKSCRAQEMIDAVQKLRAAGILCSMTLITGLGGRAKTRLHALESAKLVTAAKPAYLGLLTLTLGAGAPLTEDYLAGRFKLLSPEEFAAEQLLFLQNVDSEGTVMRSNHASNYVSLAGTLNRDREAMIQTLERAIAGQRFKPERFRAL